MINNLNSKIIDLYRFPLCVFVVFIHYIGVGEMAFHATNICEVSLSDTYNFIRILFSRVISQVAVPGFFLISGYLFFLGFSEWEWRKYWEKVKRRIHSLLVPYIIWVTLWVLYNRILDATSLSREKLYDVLFANWHIFGYYYNCIYADTDNISWIGTVSPTCCPVFIPFWFIRDLISMVILAPLIYFALKKAKRIFIFLLILAYISQIWPVIPGISIRSICFFSLGGYLAIYYCKIPKSIIKSSYISTIIIAILCCINYHSHIYWHLLPLFVLSAGLTLWDIGLFLIKKHIQIPKLFTSATFFIFAFHIFLLKPLELLTKLNISSYWALIILYFIVPFVTICSSIWLYSIMDKYCHGLIKILVGRQS